MGEEVNSTENAQGAQPDQGGAPPDQRSDGLFSDETYPTDVELGAGEPDTAIAPASDQGGTPPGEKPESPAPLGNAPDLENKGEVKPEGGEDTKDKGDAVKPPPGFVPYQAVTDERYKRQAAVARVHELEAENARLKQASTAPAPAAPDEFKDFKEKTQAEIEALAEDDPAEATKYLYKLSRFREHQARETENARLGRERQAAQQSIVADAVSEIERAVPGIYDQATGIGQKLTEFAGKHGLSTEVAAYLSDPRTLVIPAGSDRPLMLGRGAAQVVAMLNSVFNVAGNTDAKALRDSIRKEIETEVTQRVTQQLTQKFKESPGSSSLGDLPAAHDMTPGSAPETEDEWNTLSEADRRKYLGG